ncbi:MAG: Asp-tRNA(Asn)/Glu-tRNA(Gln) amidotransferase subunit GatC [Candidatus Woykebacteria bacterium]
MSEKTKLSKEQVENVAKLANIVITQKEQKKYSKDLSEAISYNISHLEKIDTNGVVPTAHVTGENTITRQDETQPGLTEEEALKNAPSTHNNLFKVPHIFGDE